MAGGGGGGGILEVLLGLLAPSPPLLLWFLFPPGFGRFFHTWSGFLGGKFESFSLADFITFCATENREKELHN